MMIDQFENNKNGEDFPRHSLLTYPNDILQLKFLLIKAL